MTLDLIKNIKYRLNDAGLNQKCPSKKMPEQKKCPISNPNRIRDRAKKNPGSAIGTPRTTREPRLILDPIGRQ
jgi:hypothetical protein